MRRRQRLSYTLRCHYKVLLHFFFFNDTATTEIYTLSLHDALPIYQGVDRLDRLRPFAVQAGQHGALGHAPDRKSTRLNSSHLVISYAVFCLKKKKEQRIRRSTQAILIHDHIATTTVPAVCTCCCAR